MSQPSLCVTLTAPTTAELRRRRDEVADADLIELRLDTVRDPNVAAALAGRRRPVIVTCRPAWEGGQFAGSEEERRRILREAIELGAEYVDIEWRAGFDDLLSETRGRGIVLSCHDFDGVPADLTERVRAMRATGAEVVKIAVTAKRLSDCVPLLDLGNTRTGSAQSPAQSTVAIAMGEAGLASRVLAARFGSKWTYAGSERHVGQLSAEALLRDYRFRTLTSATAIYGLLGKPVSHSVSPAMHNAAFAAAGHDAVYLPFPAADTDDFVTFRPCARHQGREHHDAVQGGDARARQRGAAGRAADRRHQHDPRGHRPLDRRQHRRGGVSSTAPEPRAARRHGRGGVLGAGGAARAVAVALAGSGARVRVHARNRPKAESVATLATSAAEARALAAGAGKLGPAGQLHAGRHVPARGRDADPGGSSDGHAMSTTSSTTRT